MFARRLGLLATIGAAAATLLIAQGAYAAGGGENAGVSGFVFDNVTGGGVSFAGSCEYSMTSRVTISGRATATSTPTVASTTITCTVEHPSPSPPTVSSGSMAGPVATTTSAGQLQLRGTAVCIEMSAVTGTGATVDTGQFCVS